jgi:hypothetical protein
VLEALAAVEAGEPVEAVPAVLGPAASCEGCGALPGAGAVVPAQAGGAAVHAQARQHARITEGRDTTRA